MKTHDSAAVVIPPEALWEPIQAMRRLYDRHLKEWMPHITLLYPFHPQSDDVAIRLARACGSVARFASTLSTFHSFVHGPRSHTLWIAPEPAEPLVQLQSALVQAFPDCDDTSRYPSGFSPHLSVGQWGDPLALGGVLRDLQRDWKAVRFDVTAATVIVRDATGVFHVDRAVPLKPA